MQYICRMSEKPALQQAKYCQGRCEAGDKIKAVCTQDMAVLSQTAMFFHTKFTEFVV